MEIEKKIRLAFEMSAFDYTQVFKNIYPARKSNGFTERNQSFYFVHNYLKLSPCVICWQEVPFEEIVKTEKGDKEKHGHIDSIIIDNDSIIYIEAKRISSIAKLQEIISDFKRILCNQDERGIIKIVKNKQIQQEYILCLVDIWNEGKFKGEIIKGLKSGTGFLTEKDEEYLLEGRNSVNNKIIYGFYSFNNDTEDMYKSKAINNYNIAYALYKINQ